jgi:hypothetical protein
MHAGARIVGRDRRRPERKVLDRTLVKEEHATFDRIVAATVNDALVEYLRIVDGPYASLFVRRNNPGLTADIPPIEPAAGPVGAGPVGAGPVGAAGPTGAGPVGAPAPDLDLEDDALPPEIVVPDDPSPPGSQGPKDVRSGAVDSAIDDDPEAVGPAQEDATAEAA